MAQYAIGDVQGCYQSLLKLLDTLNFDDQKDQLWFAGDLVNRGPDSLSCLRFIRELGAKVVLGNHDLHLLACFYAPQINSLKPKDTLKEVFEAPDREALMNWLRRQPLLHADRSLGLVMAHAGLPFLWSLEQAEALSQEVESAISGPDCSRFFSVMYGNQPSSWNEELTGLDRLRVITNYLTRMRFMKTDGSLDFAAKESVGSAPEGFLPWFDFPRNDELRIIFGHWAALNGVTGRSHALAIDTGCVWGGELTALNLETGERTSIASIDSRRPEK